MRLLVTFQIFIFLIFSNIFYVIYCGNKFTANNVFYKFVLVDIKAKREDEPAGKHDTGAANSSQQNLPSIY